MSVSNVSSSPANAYQPPSQEAAFRTAFQQLIQSLQSGNLTAAQQAYGILSQLASASGNSGQTGPLAQVLSQIGTALQSGNLQSAQQALSSLTQHAPTHAQAHHHHHGHHEESGGPNSATVAGGSESSSTSQPTSPSGPGSAVDLTA